MYNANENLYDKAKMSFLSFYEFIRKINDCSFLQKCFEKHETGFTYLYISKYHLLKFKIHYI